MDFNKIYNDAKNYFLGLLSTNIEENVDNLVENQEENLIENTSGSDDNEQGKSQEENDIAGEGPKADTEENISKTAIEEEGLQSQSQEDMSIGGANEADNSENVDASDE